MADSLRGLTPKIVRELVRFELHNMADTMLNDPATLDFEQTHHMQQWVFGRMVTITIEPMRSTVPFATQIPSRLPGQVVETKGDQ